MKVYVYFNFQFLIFDLSTFKMPKRKDFYAVAKVEIEGEEGGGVGVPWLVQLHPL